MYNYQENLSKFPRSRFGIIVSSIKRFFKGKEDDMYNKRAKLIDEKALKSFYDTLYPYQKKAVDASLKAIDEASEKMLGQIILPTGAGKTRIIEDLVPNLLNKIHEAENRTSVFGVACHRIILANNLLDRIVSTLTDKFGIKNLKIVVVNSGSYDKFAEQYAVKLNDGKKDFVKYFKKFDKKLVKKMVETEQKAGNHLFFVMLYQSMDQLANIDFQFDFVFCDEAHITTEQNLHQNLKDFEKHCNIVIHTTATPIDRGEIGMKNIDVYGNELAREEPKDLVFSKHIVPLQLIIKEFKDSEGKNIYSEKDISSDSAIINSIMVCAESCFKRVAENQIKANIPEADRMNGVFFVSVSGNKPLRKIIEGRGKDGKRFKAYLEKNDIDLYVTSAEQGGNVDYPETHEFDYRKIGKDEFIERLNMIGTVRKNKAIIINIDQLSEGIDLPNINSVLILRRGIWQDNCSKLLQIIGRSIRRDDYDRHLISDDSVKYYEFEKFRKPCAYLYVTTAGFYRQELDNLREIALKLYPAYGELPFLMTEREAQNGDSKKVIDNPELLKTLKKEDIYKADVDLTKIPTVEKVINLLNNVELNGEDKSKYIGDIIEKLNEENNEKLYDKIYAYAEHKAHWNVDVIYDYIHDELQLEVV